MSAIRRADAWIGKHIMHPPVIWFCQRAGVNQFVVYRMCWWIAALHVVWRDDHRNMIMSVAQRPA